MITQLFCPNFKSATLAEKTLSDDETRVDICAQCRGAWFDARELARVLSVAVSDLTVSRDARTSRVCPKCRVPMAKLKYPETNIDVDVCGDCSGIWLDRGEFRGINVARAKYQDAEKFEPPPANLKEAAMRFLDRIAEKFGK